MGHHLIVDRQDLGIDRLLCRRQDDHHYPVTRIRSGELPGIAVVVSLTGIRRLELAEDAVVSRKLSSAAGGEIFCPGACRVQTAFTLLRCTPCWL